MTAAAETQTRGRVKDRDFTKVNEQHVRLAEFMNKESGLSPVKPNHVKAMLALQKDFATSPEEVNRRAELKASREKAKAEKETKAARYAGLTDDQRKALKKAERLQAAAHKAKAEMEALFKS